MSENLNVTLAKLCGYEVLEGPEFLLRGPDGVIETRPFTESLDAHARYVWPLIENRGLEAYYLTHLMVGEGDVVPGWCDANYRQIWRVLTASPTQHTRAAIKTLGHKGE